MIYLYFLQNQTISTSEELNFSLDSFNKQLSDHMTQIDSYSPHANHLEHHWSGYQQASTQSRTAWDTGVNVDVLKYIGAKSVTVPDKFVSTIKYRGVNSDGVNLLLNLIE